MYREREGMKGFYKILTILTILLIPSCAKSYQTYPQFPRTRDFIPPTIMAPSQPLPPRLPIARPEPQPKPPMKLRPPLMAKGFLIVIDPGHGGDDYGTYSLTKPRIHEKNLALTTSHFLKTYLNQMGYQTLMTRETDVFIALDQRALFANMKQPKLFVSVHYNSAPSREAEGVEVFYYSMDEDKTRVKLSKRLAESVLKNIIQNTQANSRGVKHANFAVIRETKMAAILVEGGFLTNEQELARVKDPVYMKQIAWGIANGIDQYLKKNLPSDK